MAKLVTTVNRERFETGSQLLPGNWEVVYLEAVPEPEAYRAACADADYLMAFRADRELIESCRRLKMIQTPSVGFDKVDIDAAREKGIVVCNNKGINSAAVAEHTIALMLSALRRIPAADSLIKSDGWEKSLAEEGVPVAEMSSLSVGILGMGDIGREVAKRLGGWGCRMFYSDVSRLPGDMETGLGVRYMATEDIIEKCDIITIHVPLFPSTFHMFSAAQFRAMKPTAILVNAARGDLVDQTALADALEAGEIACAALDTLSPEPAPPGHPLLNLTDSASRRLILTPHIAANTAEVESRVMRICIENILRAERGEAPLNIVT